MVFVAIMRIRILRNVAWLLLLRATIYFCIRFIHDFSVLLYKEVQEAWCFVRRLTLKQRRLLIFVANHPSRNRNCGHSTGKKPGEWESFHKRHHTFTNDQMYFSLNLLFTNQEHNGYQYVPWCHWVNDVGQHQVCIKTGGLMQIPETPDAGPGITINRNPKYYIFRD